MNRNHDQRKTIKGGLEELAIFQEVNSTAPEAEPEDTLEQRVLSASEFLDEEDGYAGDQKEQEDDDPECGSFHGGIV